LYAANCAVCHGETGTGSIDGPSLVGLLDLTQSMLLDVIRTHAGDNDSPILSSDQEQRAAAQYLRLLSTTTRTLPGQIGPRAHPAATEEVVLEAVPGVPPAMGTIRGRVIQGTQGGASPAGLEIALHIVDHQLQEQVVTTVVDADENYQFDNVVIRPDSIYFLTLNSHDDTPFSSGIQAGNPEITDMVIDMAIYARTDDASVIEINSREIQVNLTPHGLYMIEVINLKNTSQDYVYLRDRTQEGYGLISVSFPIAENVRLEPGHTDRDRLILSENGQV
jgi:hypothetical protein